MEADEILGFRGVGVLAGSIRHLGASDTQQLTLDLIGAEAYTTSEIEGEILNRESLQSSLRRQLGLAFDGRAVGPAEQGITELMVDLHEHLEDALTPEVLFHWHRLVTNGRRDLVDIGKYRTHGAPMQIVSGSAYEPKVHFVAPPSERVAGEMESFLRWFDTTAPGRPGALAPLLRAGIAHLYFESIHPFEDGNGRLGRAIAQKALAQGAGLKQLIALSPTLQKRRHQYYGAHEQANKGLEITPWLKAFSSFVLEAQRDTQSRIDLLIAKVKLFDRLRGQLNPRQEKILLRLFDAGPEGFEGGLSAEKYIRLTGASPATTTRDLQDLVEKGALTRTGERKHTRYQLSQSFSGD